MTNKSFINHRVLWLLIPLLTLFNSSAWADWTLCTSTSDFVANSYYMFVAETAVSSNYYYVKATSTEKSAGAWSSASDTCTACVADPTTLTLKQAGWKLIAGASSGQWKLQSNLTSTLYLNTSTANNGLRANPAATASSYWTITKHATKNTFAFKYYIYSAKDGDVSRYISEYTGGTPYGMRSYKTTNYVKVYKWSESKTVSSISIKTAPTKTTYCAGDNFDPTGLVITATYSDATTGDISYAEHSSDFSFLPATNASLTTLNTSVTVTYATKTANQSITVNTAYAIACDGSIANGSISANSTACAGEEVTLTATPSTHYHLGSWTITKHSDGTNITASVLDGNTLTMPAYAVDVTATFAEDSYKTVVFKNNGGLLFDDGGSASTYDATNKWKQKVYVGDAPAMPTSLVDETDNCDANSTSFYGWTKTTWSNKIADKDALDDWIDEDDSHEVYTSDDDLATVAAGDPATIVYHAVWAEGSGSGGFQQITSLDDIQEGSAYFAYYGQYSSVNSWYGVNAIGTVVAPVDVSEGVITTSKTGDGAYSLLEFTIVESDAENREYYIKVGNKYVTGSTTNKAALTLGDDAYLWKFMSINSTTYNLEIKHVASTSCWIKVGVGSLTSGKFGSYTSSGNQVSMFQSTGTAYENFLTTCCEAPTAPTNGSFLWTAYFIARKPFCRAA